MESSTAAPGKITDDRAAIVRDVVRLLEQMVDEEWQITLSEPMGPDTRLVADLTFTSVDLVALLSDIEELYQRRDWPFEELLMVDGRYVDDLTVAEIADFLQLQGALTR